MGAELLPTGEQVAVEWLKANVPYLQGFVAPSLPKESADWAQLGFVTVASIGGGRGSMPGERISVVGLTYYGVALMSGKPPWKQTAQMVEQVRAVVDPTGVAYAGTRGKYRLTNLGNQYLDARVMNVEWLSEPQRRPGDTADFAMFTNDIALHWVVVNA